MDIKFERLTEYKKELERKMQKANQENLELKEYRTLHQGRTASEIARHKTIRAMTLGQLKEECEARRMCTDGRRAPSLRLALAL